MKNKMKKILVFMGVVAIVIGGHVYSKQSSVKMSSLMLENIEALADSETDGVHCFGKGLVVVRLITTKCICMMLRIAYIISVYLSCYSFPVLQNQLIPVKKHILISHRNKN